MEVHCVNIPHFHIHSSVEGHLGCFHSFIYCVESSNKLVGEDGTQDRRDGGRQVLLREGWSNRWTLGLERSEGE